MSARTYLTVLTTLLGLETSATSLLGEERFYMAMFAYQGEPNLPRNVHTYAVFVRASDAAKGEEDPRLEIQSISWMPRSLSVSALRRAPEAGINLSLEESNRVGRSIGSAITMWGPYRIKKELYEMAARQKERLDRNAIAYVCIDRGYRGGTASNCIHAVSDLDVTQGPLETGTARGNAASMMVLRHLERYIVSTDEDSTWLCNRLNLKPTEIRFATPQVRTSAATASSTAAPFGYRDFWTGIVWPAETGNVNAVARGNGGETSPAANDFGYRGFWAGIVWPVSTRD